MRKLFRLFWALFLPFAASAQPDNAAPGQLLAHLHADQVPSQLVIDLREGRPAVALTYGRALSQQFDMHLFRFDPQQVDPALALAQLRKHPGVIAAQYNHRIQRRSRQATDPSDPDYPSQWHLKNTGQVNGGSPDADIDADEAWDLTRSGPSALGDTLVVAVIDDGFDLQHEDLRWWKNRGEIPGNGRDDDGNGYVDDYHGWNAYFGNGNVPKALHGTEVAGVLGALTDNGVGVSGVSWGLPMMPVGGASELESIVIEAYGYALAQRRRYDTTGGAQGAYVVATNGSFGVDNGNPANFPLWCAIYDSLGQAGIINVAATMNRDLDVEQSGDVPIRCSSDYLISVSVSTAADTRWTGAAYGARSIDLVAPGVGIYTTLTDDQYGFDSGTSFAAPQVTGVLALMLARACPALMLRYQRDPSGTLLLLREALLTGVDTLPALVGFSQTGGRLNARRALEAVDAICASLPSECLPPFRANARPLTDSSALLGWSAVDSSATFRLRYRPAGAATWADSLSVDTLFYLLTGLDGCTDYEWQVGTRCPSGTVDYAPMARFTSEGCCLPPSGLALLSRSDSSLSLAWDAVFGASQYRLRYRPQGTTAWQTQAETQNQGRLRGLSPCTTYEVAVQVTCAGIDRGYTDSLLLSTSGCGACLDFAYCRSRGTEVDFEWIERVSLGPIDQRSGPNDGYAAFTDTSYRLPVDQILPIDLTPGYDGSAFPQAWRVWIDLNRDGRFDPAERLIDTGPVTGVYGDDLVIPDSAGTGPTRMRVSMRFAGFSGEARPGPCEVFSGDAAGGEVEDYCVRLRRDTSGACAPPSQLEATFRGDTLALSWQGGTEADSFEVQLIAQDGSGNRVYQGPGVRLAVADLPPCTPYQVQVQAHCADGPSAFSEPIALTSRGCGFCQDWAYCANVGRSDSLWIDYLQLGAYANASGNNAGYGRFTDPPASLILPEDGQLTLVAGHQGMPDTAYWKVGLDANGDGIFTYPVDWNNRAAAPGDTLRGYLDLPELAQPRLRILLSRVPISDACTPVGVGEVEDYCLNVGISSVDAPAPPAWQVYPNPSTGQVNITADQPLRRLRWLDLRGRVLRQATFAPQRQLRWTLDPLAPGLYLLMGETVNGAWLRQKVWVK